MQLTEVGLEAEATIVDLLSAGFVHRPAQFWRAGLTRIAQIDRHSKVAWLLGDPLDPDGVLLSLRNIATEAPSGGSSVQVNLSSWYVKDSARSQALWMLHKVSRQTGFVFTDLTPSETVAKMLPKLGYLPISGGTARLPTARTAMLGSAGWKILDAEQTCARLADSTRLKAMRDHQQLGCLVLGLSREKEVFPLVLKYRWRRRVIPVVEIIYMPACDGNTPNLREALPDLAAYLIKRGLMFIEIEQTIEPELALTIPHKLVNHSPRYARGAYQTSGINHLYSELIYFGV